MAGQLSLFAEPTPPKPALLERLQPRLRAWADDGIYFGTSSWKYPGWQGQIYNKKYKSQRAFEETCIAEYAETFPTVCADFALYDFPHASTMRKIADATPEHFALSLKVTDRITVLRYPTLPRYGANAGRDNPDFLNAELFQESFLQPLAEMHGKVGAIIFEFSTFAPNSGMDVAAFAARMDAFFAQLPKGFHYAVEVRNREFLQPLWLDVLKRHNIAHVLNNWTRMPPIIEQLHVPGTLPADFAVIRALLKPGRAYAEAVAKFQPYQRIQEENPELRAGLVESVERAVAEGRKLFAYVNNRAEGNAPLTIDAVLEKLEPSRGRRKRRA
jgi:uncharacterized protein YecE (DUF72 family)